MSLALKYRPSTLDELVGQDVVVRILRNSFLMGDLSTPLLLVGASGVGKTTCARIVSLCLNCESGPTADPCGECASCVSIKSLSNPDVIEMDAASNTGVDDIRVVLESSTYLPSCSRYKVYIIDEVHMLSVSAFNALLKTLESPAEHVRFIMATTEVRKVPITVISRCQRMDLLKLPVDVLHGRLARIANLESIKHDDESLTVIAENSSGSMRNALFLLEQSYIYTKNSISSADVRKLLGCVDRNILEDILKCVLLNDARKAVEKFRNVCSQNMHMLVLEGMLSVVYEMCVHSVGVDTKVELGDSLLKIEKANSTSFLSRLWQSLSQGIQEVKGSDIQQQTGEILIIRLCYMSDLPSPKKLASYILSREQEGVSEKKKF